MNNLPSQSNKYVPFTNNKRYNIIKIDILKKY